MDFLSQLNDKVKQNTKRMRYSLLNAFFNFAKNNLVETISNPCDSVMLKKIFRKVKNTPWTILEKETIDEIIFRTHNPRNRIMLELMARGGMRIGEVLKIRAQDIEDKKIILHGPKSGKQTEVVFIPQKVADRLKGYVRDKKIDGSHLVFPIKYSGARIMVKKAGIKVGVFLRPHDLRRHAATFASRAGTPIEIVSKVILRHGDLSTTQRYLGKVCDTEASRWIDNLYN